MNKKMKKYILVANIFFIYIIQLNDQNMFSEKLKGQKNEKNLRGNEKPNFSKVLKSKILSYVILY